MSIIDRTLFAAEPKGDGFTGTVHLGTRSVEVRVRGGDTATVWAQAEFLLVYLQEQMSRVEEAVRNLLLRLDGFTEDTPKGRRKIERLLSQVSESDMTCVIHEDHAFVYLDQPRLTDHIIEMRFKSGANLISTTIAG